jgi:glycosyltransferase involved in cell wall biosynthesis
MADVIRKEGHQCDIIYAELNNENPSEEGYNKTDTYDIIPKGRVTHYLKHLYLFNSIRKLIKQKNTEMVVIACDIISLQALYLISNKKVKKGYWCFEEYDYYSSIFSLDYYRVRRYKSWVAGMDFYLASSYSRLRNLEKLGVSLPCDAIFNCKQLKPSSANTERQSKYEKFEKLLVYAGRVSPTQFINEIVDAMELLSDSIGLIIAGPGHKEFTDQLNAQIVANAKLKDRVLYLGRISRADVYDLIDEADAGFVFYDDIAPGIPIDPAPNKIGDYIAGNTWMIGSGQKYIRDWLEDKGTGVCIDEINAENIARAINTVLEDRRFADKNTLRKIYENELNMEKEFQKLNSLIVRL